VFNGCNRVEELGRSPSGRIYVSSIQTQEAIMDSGTFEISIYKDK
jgi:hypothetical protein